MIKVQLPAFVRFFFPGTIWREKTDEKKVFITFDDGPIPEVTPWVLDQLDKHDVKATFFCVGDNVRKYPELYQEVLKRGHRVGNHTFNHVKAWTTSRRDYFENISVGSSYIESDLFRPPHGQLYPWYVKRLRKRFAKIVMWDVLTLDFDQKLNGKDVLTNLTKHVRQGSIIVFHDSLKSMKNLECALPECLDWLKSNGYVTERL